MSWIEVIFNFIHNLWPLRVVNSYQRGVRFWLGNDVKELDGNGKLLGIKTGGLYAFLPFFGNIETVTIVPDVMDLGVHSVLTKDDRSITFSANIAYEIVNVRDMFTKVQDFQSSLARVAEGHLAQRIRDWDYSELVLNQKELEKSLKGTLETRAKGWGVQINAVYLTDLVPAKQFRVYGILETGGKFY